MPESDASSMVWFDPKDGVPFPDNQIAFYRQYIEAVCVDPAAKAAALAALEARNQKALDKILIAQPDQPEEEALRRFKAAGEKVTREMEAEAAAAGGREVTGLTEAQEEEMLRELGYDV